MPGSINNGNKRVSYLKMKSNLAWRAALFTSDLPMSKILLKTWRSFDSLRWAAADWLKLFRLRKLINDCCHERWGNQELGSSGRLLGRESFIFQDRMSPFFYTTVKRGKDGLYPAGGAGGGRRFPFLVGEVGWGVKLLRLCGGEPVPWHRTAEGLLAGQVKVSRGHIWLFLPDMKSLFLSPGLWQSPDRF